MNIDHYIDGDVYTIRLKYLSRITRSELASNEGEMRLLRWNLSSVRPETSWQMVH